MAIALVANAAGQAFTLTGNALAGPIDTTGATLLVAVTVTNDAQTTPEDTNMNTWVAIPATAQTLTIFSQVYYVKNPTVGSGHIFGCSGTNRAAAIAVVAFSGTDITENVDQASGAANLGSPTIQAGSITPSVNNEVVVNTYGGNHTGTCNIDSSYIQTDQLPFNSGVAYAVALAYIIQTSAAATDPTRTPQTPGSINHAHASSYKASSGAAATVKQLAALGVG